MNDETAVTFQARTEEWMYLAIFTRLFRARAWAMAGVASLVPIFWLVKGDWTGVVIGVVIAGGMVLWAPRYAASMVVKRDPAKIGHIVAYRVDHDGIHTTAGFETTSWPWSRITKVEQWRGQVACFMGRRRIITLPTGSLNADEKARLLTLLHTRGMAARSAPSEL
ncbi:YcxB family protein [Actinoplanes sp. NPDC051494]|uniref:YcxB family protein n=1 Tax=Actinoplanes sp. NPDC051494 TaxID=3363907 RepID=UPI0037B5FC5F